MGRPAAARKQSVSADKNGARDRMGRFGTGNPGRPKGAKSKTTRIQLEAAREAFAPMAKMALDKGAKHLKSCKLDGCGSCQWWGNVAFQYVYGKPTQPIEIDSAAQQEALARLSELTGKPAEELAREAERDGLPLIANGRRVV